LRRSRSVVALTALVAVGAAAVTAIAIYVAFVLAGPGHGSPSPALKILFPYLLIAIWLDIPNLEGRTMGVVFAALQFPTYGICLAMARSRRRLAWTGAAISCAHLLAVAVCQLLPW